MSENTKAVFNPTAIGRFADGFRDMYYLVSTNEHDFDINKFRNFFNNEPHILDGSCVTVAPEDEKNGAYNVHFQWQKLTSSRCNFRIEYYKGPRPHEPDEHEPFAEGFMAWFGQFFKLPTAKAHVHARFRYELSDRRSVYHLPTKTNLADGAELYGIALRLTANDNGVSSIKLTQTKAAWLVEAIAERAVEFKNFEPFRDVEILAGTVSKFLEQSS